MRRRRPGRRKSRENEMETPTWRVYVTEAVRYWEPRRLVYNLVAGCGSHRLLFRCGAEFADQAQSGHGALHLSSCGAGERGLLRAYAPEHLCADVSFRELWLPFSLGRVRYWRDVRSRYHQVFAIIHVPQPAVTFSSSSPLRMQEAIHSIET